MQNWSQQVFQSLCDYAQGLDLLKQGQNLEEANHNDHVEPRYVDDEILNVLPVVNGRI